MEVQGPRNPGRPESGRTGASADATRTKANREGLSGAAADRVEIGDTRVVDRAVESVREELERRFARIHARHEELLARADDAAAIRRAALALLRAGIDRDDRAA